MYLKIFVIGCLVTDETDKNPCNTETENNKNEQKQNVLIEKVKNKKMKTNEGNIGLIQANERASKQTQPSGLGISSSLHFATHCYYSFTK